MNIPNYVSLYGRPVRITNDEIKKLKWRKPAERPLVSQELCVTKLAGTKSHGKRADAISMLHSIDLGSIPRL